MKAFKPIYSSLSTFLLPILHPGTHSLLSTSYSLQFRYVITNDLPNNQWTDNGVPLATEAEIQAILLSPSRMTYHFPGDRAVSFPLDSAPPTVVDDDDGRRVVVINGSGFNK